MSHRAHALEGQLFGPRWSRAARTARLPCTTLVERALYDTAATRLKAVPGALAAAVKDLVARSAGRARRRESRDPRGVVVLV